MAVGCYFLFYCVLKTEVVASKFSVTTLRTNVVARFQILALLELVIIYSFLLRELYSELVVTWKGEDSITTNVGVILHVFSFLPPVLSLNEAIIMHIRVGGSEGGRLCLLAFREPRDEL